MKARLSRTGGQWWGSKTPAKHDTRNNRKRTHLSSKLSYRSGCQSSRSCWSKGRLCGRVSSPRVSVLLIAAAAPQLVNSGLRTPDSGHQLCR